MRSFFSLYYIIFISFFGFAQNEIVSLENFDQEKLNLYLVDYVNELRVRKRRKPLSYYSELNNAAKNHALYMASKEYLGHFQRNKGYKTVKDRVKKFGADAEFVGENVQYISIQHEIERFKQQLTYQELAKILGENWRKSRGHYENIIDKEYTGVTHQFVLSNGLLYACQVLSSELYKVGN